MNSVVDEITSIHVCLNSISLVDIKVGRMWAVQQCISEESNNSQIHP